MKYNVQNHVLLSYIRIHRIKLIVCWTLWFNFWIQTLKKFLTFSTLPSEILPTSQIARTTQHSSLNEPTVFLMNFALDFGFQDFIFSLMESLFLII